MLLPARHIFNCCCEWIVAFTILFTIQHQTDYNRFEKVIKSDGMGYYAYLPAVFIYGDYTFSFTETISGTYEKMDFGGGFMNETPQGRVNKYFIGVSLLWLPFFLLAHLVSLLSGFPADGYSLPYQLAVLAASNFYLWLGCKFIYRILLSIVLPGVAAALLVFTVFGTNLLLYTTFDASHTHVYSFAVIAAFLYASFSFFRKKERRYLYLASSLLGLIALIRPTNLVIALLFPFAAGSVQNGWNTLLLHKKSLLPAGLVLGFTLLPQFMLYYLQTGNFIVWSYGDEKFFFDQPEFINVLFSYRKGLFIYTPMALLSLAGLWYVFRQNKFQFAVFLLCMFTSVYIIASWWCWWYGASLGQRAFIDYYAILALLLAYSYVSLNKKYLKILFFMAAVAFTGYSLILVHQYRLRIIDWDNMSRPKFWFTFLKTDRTLEGLAFCNELFDDTETATIVNIKASNGKYLCSDRNEQSEIVADKDRAMRWETYNMLEQPENKMAFKADDGNYLSAGLYGNILTHAAKKTDVCEQFQMTFLDDETFILKACNEKFLAFNGSNFSASSDSLNAEHFYLIRR